MACTDRGLARVCLTPHTSFGSTLPKPESTWNEVEEDASQEGLKGTRLIPTVERQ